MTADPRRRKQRTRLGALLAVILTIGAVVSAVVAVATLRTSEAGTQVAPDARLVVSFPSTPTMAIAVVDDQDRLASLAVATLSPAGVGGSLVTVPVNVDTSFGFGDERTPLSSRPFAPGDDASVEDLIFGLESILSITIPDGVVLGPDELDDVIDELAPVEVDLPEAVVDSDAAADGTEEVAGSGLVTLAADEVVAVLTAIDIDGVSYDHHDVDVAMWEALAQAITDSPLGVDVPLDDDGRPIDPATTDELLVRLLSGPVGHRDLAINPEAAAELDESATDFVLLDRPDALLVFAEIAPALVSKPNQSLSFQIVAPFSDEQIATLGADATTVGVVSDLIGELLFASGNVVSVQTSPVDGGAGEITRLEVVDERSVEAVEEVAPILFGDVEVVVAPRVIDGVDVVAVLGTDFLVRRAEIRAEGEVETSFLPGDENDPGRDDGEGDFESDDDDAGGAGAESTDDSETAPDTVAADE